MAFTQRSTSIEWGFLAAMVALCGTLTALQYHWTGELAHAEVARLRGNLAEQSQVLTRDFDDELTRTCAQLRPTGNEIDELGRDAAFAERVRKWLATNPRPMFSRLAILVTADDAPGLFSIDLKTGKLAPMVWPGSWGELHDHLGRKGGGPPERLGGGRPQPPPERPAPPIPPGDRLAPDGDRPPLAADRPGPPPDRPELGGNRGKPPEGRDKPPPPRNPGGAGSPPAYMDRNGLLLEFPLVGGRSRVNDNAEYGWMILELDFTYVSQEWLPQLVRQYLDPEGSGLDDIVVQAPGSTRPPILSLRRGNEKGAADVSIEFNHEGRGNGPQRGLSARSAWTLDVWHRLGAFESMVAVSRRRNLAIAAGLNLLMMVAGALLVRHTRRSRQLAEAQMNFVANVSHELRTPLTVIRGAAHNLERGVVQEPAQIERYLRLIIDHGNQLSGMVEQVLAYASAKKSTALLNRQPVAIKDLLSEAIANAAHDVGGTPCEVEVTVSRTLPVVTGDPAALRRVFQNLIANAVKHGGEGGWIGVTVRETNDVAPAAIEVQVADHGPGIPEQEQREIFKPFTRGATAQSRQVRGSGLGLSLAREIVEAHGGTIGVTSRPGAGATFTVRLPA